jgi:3-deoxy-D-manno-octulosonic acid (KDO) 8-phosphate synthase
LVGDGIYLYYKNGGSDKIGSDISLNKTAQAYSQMRKKKNVPFVFEGSLQPTNNISKQAFKQKNIRYVI